MMNNIKKLIITGVAVLTLTLGSITAFAVAQYATPAEAVAGLSGREVQSVIDERAQTGKTYGAMANEAGVLDVFKKEMLEMKKDIVAARVANGTMTKEQADAVISRIEKNQANCDGTGTGCGQNGKGLGTGTGFGQSNRKGRGQQGNGRGMGNDRGMGNGLCGGSCGQ